MTIVIKIIHHEKLIRNLILFTFCFCIALSFSVGSRKTENRVLSREELLFSSNLNYTYANFTPSIISSNILNCSIDVINNDTDLTNGTEKFRYSTKGQIGGEWITAHKDNFSNLIVDNWWEQKNHENGIFNETIEGLLIDDQGNHVWKWNLINGLVEEAPVLFQNITGDFTVETLVNTSLFSNDEHRGGVLLNWDGGYLKISLGLQPDLMNRVIRITHYANSTENIVINSFLDANFSYFIKISRIRDEFSIDLKASSANYDNLLERSFNIPRSIMIGLIAEQGGKILVDDWDISPWINSSPISNSTNNYKIQIFNIPLNYQFLESNVVDFSINDTNLNEIQSEPQNVSIDASSGDLPFLHLSPNFTASLKVDLDLYLNLLPLFSPLRDDTESFAFSSDGSLPNDFISDRKSVV